RRGAKKGGTVLVSPSSIGSTIEAAVSKAEAKQQAPAPSAVVGAVASKAEAKQQAPAPKNASGANDRAASDKPAATTATAPESQTQPEKPLPDEASASTVPSAPPKTAAATPHARKAHDGPQSARKKRPVVWFAAGMAALLLLCLLARTVWPTQDVKDDAHASTTDDAQDVALTDEERAAQWTLA